MSIKAMQGRQAQRLALADGKLKESGTELACDRYDGCWNAHAKVLYGVGPKICM